VPESRCGLHLEEAWQADHRRRSQEARFPHRPELAARARKHTLRRLAGRKVRDVASVCQSSPGPEADVRIEPSFDFLSDEYRAFYQPDRATVFQASLWMDMVH